MSNFKIFDNSLNRVISRGLLIFEKIIIFFMTAYMANNLKYSDIGFWSQILFSASLFTSLASFNIANGIIAVIPRIKSNKDRFRLIFKSGSFLLIVGIGICFFLILIKDFLSNILFDDFLNLNIFLIILVIGFADVLLEFLIYSFRSIRKFENSNKVLFLRIFPRVIVFFGIYKNDLNLMLYLYSLSYAFSCLIILFSLFKSNKENILLILKEKKNKLFFIEPRPHFNSLFLLSKRSIIGTLIASLFFFLVRRVTLSSLGLKGLGEFSLAISAGATLLSLTTFVGFTFYPYVSSLAITEKTNAYNKTNKLSLKFIYLSIIISLILVIMRIFLSNTLNFYPFTINTIDLILAFLGYGFLAGYQISHPFAFALTNNIKIVKIEFLSSLISFAFIGLILLADKFTIHMAMTSFCLYTFANYLQAKQRNFKILNEKTIYA